VTERLCVIIPALNAARTVEAVIHSAKEHIADVVVVDDGSKDDTGRVAEDAGAMLLRHPVNRGKGGALKTAFAWAREQGFEGVITIDADGQHLAHEIPKFIEARSQTGADLIIGGRAHLFGQMLPRRRTANRFSAWTIAKASGTKVTDSQSGYRYYSRRLLDSVKLRTNGFDMESEVIVRAGRAGLAIVTIPIDLGFVNGISTSHYKPIKDSLKIAWTVARIRFFDFQR
jgi:glycosyltransferase involved in cell wall biosynthesis